MINKFTWEITKSEALMVQWPSQLWSTFSSFTRILISTEFEKQKDIIRPNLTILRDFSKKQDHIDRLNRNIFGLWEAQKPLLLKFFESEVSSVVSAGSHFNFLENSLTRGLHPAQKIVQITFARDFLYFLSITKIFEDNVNS